MTGTAERTRNLEKDASESNLSPFGQAMFDVSGMAEPYFHGTTASAASDLHTNGICERKLQSRDRGFFGEGLYVTTEYDIAHGHATTVSSKRGGEPEIVRVSIPNGDVFPAGDALPDDGGLKPVGTPEWLTEFVDWYVRKVEEAAVWEQIPNIEREDVVPRARREMTPAAEAFEREDWYPEVTEFAFDDGYDVVRWSASEIVINPQADVQFD